MAIRVICKNCLSKIDAKDELLGQIKKCPKCKSPLLIEPENKKEQNNIQNTVTEKAIASPNPNIVYDSNEGLQEGGFPKILKPNHKYFILAHDRIVAYWEISKGWQYNAGTGFVAAKRNKDAIPYEGTFVFVEMIIKQTDSGRHLAGLRMFSITAKWALPLIAREPHEILTKIVGTAILSKQQRNQMITYLRKNYMPDFLNNSKEIYDYLMSEYSPVTEIFASEVLS